MNINLFGVSALAGFLTCIGISLFVYFKNRTNAINRWYSIVVACMALWCLDSFLVAVFPSQRTLHFHKIIYLGAIFSQVCFVHWVHKILGKVNKFQNFVFLIFFLAALFLSIQSISGNLTTQINDKHLYSQFFG